jgi:AcrR family transcriptional regulator
MPRRSAAATAATHDELIETALRLASVDGLEGLTLGRLADAVGMSKSGALAHFGGKEELQLQTLARAIEMFMAAVYRPVAPLPPGRERLLALCRRWFDFLSSGQLPGGCFMTTASVEYDARNGPVHDQVEQAMRRWLRSLEREIAAAQAARTLAPSLNARDTAFAINALVAGANVSFQLHGDADAFRRAQRVIERLLERR